MNELKRLRTEIDKKLGRREQLKNELAQKKLTLAKCERGAMRCKKAQAIIQDVAKLTQQELEYHIAELVTLAMESVFENPYRLIVEFIIQRGKTETKLQLFDDETNSLLNPITDCGGGIVDVAAFALQVSLWTLQPKKSRNVLILDEPLKWLKGGDLPNRGAEMIKEISQKLNLQIIMVSHSPELIESADRVFEVKKIDSISNVLTMEK